MILIERRDNLVLNPRRREDDDSDQKAMRYKEEKEPYVPSHNQFPYITKEFLDSTSTSLAW